MTDSPGGGGAHERPKKRTVDCSRCKDSQITTRKRHGLHLCEGCKEDLREIDYRDPLEDREITPMDKRWR